MSYKPYKKDIKFVDSITSHPEYKQTRKVITATADDKFREWLLTHCQKAASGAIEGYRDAGLPAQLYKVLNELVVRKVEVRTNVLIEAQSVFYPKPNIAAIALLLDMCKSLLDIQRFERQLRKVESSVKDGKAAYSYAKTRDGENPKYKPRNRQFTKYVK